MIPSFVALTEQCDKAQCLRQKFTFGPALDEGMVYDLYVLAAHISTSTNFFFKGKSSFISWKKKANLSNFISLPTQNKKSYRPMSAM